MLQGRRTKPGGARQKRRRANSNDAGSACSFAGCGYGRFVDLQDLVGADALQRLKNAAGPMDFDGLRGGFGADAEVHALVAGRKIAARGGYGGELGAVCGDEFDFGADGVAVAFVADELQREPMILRWRFVVKNVDGAVVRGNDGVEAAVIIDVADGHAAAKPGPLKNGAGVRGDIHELFAGVSKKKHRFAIAEIWVVQFNSVQVVALRDKEIFPSIVVVIQKANAPSGVQHGGARNAGAEAGIGETGVTIVLVERVALVGEIRDDQVRPAIIVIVGEVDAHTGVGAAVTVNGNLREQADLFERSVAFVVIKKFDHRVVGDKQIDMSVAIEVRNGDAEALARFRKADFLRNLGEVAVAVIVVDQGRDRPKNVGMAVRTKTFFVLAAPDVVEIPLEVAKNHEIEQAVII